MIVRLVSVVVVVVAALAGFVRLRWTVVRVSGASMQPTLHDGDRLLARRRRTGHPLNRGDLVVLHRPTGPPTLPAGARAVAGEPPHDHRNLLIKRVAALPGDPLPDGVPGGRTVPAGHVVVLSDNDGLDSRLFGPVPRANITAVVTRSLR